MRQKLTSRSVEYLANHGPRRLEIFDTALPGFGVRVGVSGSKSWFCVTRHQGRVRRFTLGPYAFALLVVYVTIDILLINRDRSDAEIELETCRNRLIEPLGNEVAARIGPLVLAIGRSVRVINEANVTFMEREPLRVLVHTVAIVSILLAASTATLWATFHSLGSIDARAYHTMILESTFVPAIGLALFLLVRTRKHLDARMFESAEASFFVGIREVLVDLRGRARPRGTKEITTVGADLERTFGHQDDPASDAPETASAS